MNPLPKRYGKQMPSSVDNGARICFSIIIPDQLEYRAALMGQLNDLGLWFTWDHTQADYYSIPEKNKQVAQLWLDTVAGGSFGDCMDICSQIIACIQDNPATQAAIRNFVLNDTTINQHIENLSRTGQPIPEVEIPIVQGCDPDPAWGAVDAIIEQMHVNNTDFFEMFELETNRIEQVSTLISAIPRYGELPVDELLQFANQLFENISENYAGAVTTLLKNEWKCDLFCIGINDTDCILRFDAIYDYFKDRIGGTFTIESAFDIVMQFLADGTFTGSLIADFMMMMQIEVLRSTNNFLNLNVLSLNTVASLGALNPSDAWELLCPNCVEPPGPIIVLATTDWQVAGSAEAQYPVQNGVLYTYNVTGTTAGYGGANPPYNADGIPGSNQQNFPISTQSGRLCAFIQASPSNSAWFPLGVSGTFTANRTGVLRFAIADAAGGYANNTGQLLVTITP